MDEVKINKVDKWKHILIWFLITVLICIFDPPSPDKALYLFVIGMALIMTSYIIVYYAHFLYIFPKYLGKNVIKLIFTSFSIFIILLVINYTQDYYISTINGGISDFEGAPVYELAALLGIFFLIIVVMALGNYQNRLSIHKANSEFNEEKVLLTKSIGFFQNQFNPHITFNFLNFCYGTILKKSKQGAEAIGLFSDILRHSITNKAGEAIPLSKELEYIRNFIDLHEHLDKSIQINFEIIGEVTNKMILPRILITFIENAIKHGEIHSKEYPVQVKIYTEKTKIRLTVENKKRLKPNFVRSKSGIGQINSKQQLELFYKSKYNLVTNDSDGMYYCELTINY